jgi:aspartate/methionine/tyrosine aminotransferase
MSRLGTETAFEVLVKARALEAQGKNIIHLEIGEPDFDTPANIIKVAKDALDQGYTHYGPSAGLVNARESIMKYVMKTRPPFKCTIDEIVITPGGKPVMFYVILATINEGDEVIYPNPGFPIYESMINFVGGKAVPLQLKEEKDFRFDIEDLKALITPKTRMLIINTPQNPTGGILTKEDIEAIAKLAVKHDLLVLSDEIYSQIVYDDFKPYSLLQIPEMKERTILLDGFSKTYAMTGWRLGFGIMPKDLATLVAKLQTNCASCTSSFTQIAGTEALDGDQSSVKKMVNEFKKRRDVIVDGLNTIPGFHCLKPKGAFYVFPSITGTGMSSKEMADYLLNEAGVACLSGTAFGNYGEGYIRFSYANSLENINEALKRVKEAVVKLPKK